MEQMTPTAYAQSRVGVTGRIAQKARATAPDRITRPMTAPTLEV